MVLSLLLTSEELFKILSPRFHSKKSLYNFLILCSGILKLSLQLQITVMCIHWGPLTKPWVPSRLPIQEATAGEHLTFPKVQSTAGGHVLPTSCHMVTQLWLKLLLASAGVTKPFWVGGFQSCRDNERSNIWLIPPIHICLSIILHFLSQIWIGFCHRIHHKFQLFYSSACSFDWLFSLMIQCKLWEEELFQFSPQCPAHNRPPIRIFCLHKLKMFTWKR